MRTAISFAWKMIKEKRQRAFLLIASTAIASFLLFTSYFFIYSLDASLKAVDGRLGADLIVVPKGTGPMIGNSLVVGSNGYTYFDEKQILEKLASISDIKEMSSQLYLETISTSCCGTMGDFPIVAFDPENDFTLKAWMPGAKQLAKDEIVIGVKAGGDRFLYHYNDKTIKEKVMLFLQPFHVKNVLFPTGTNADETLFMRLDTARELIEENEALAHLHKTDVSVIFINTNPYTEFFVKQQIETAADEVDVVFGSQLKERVQQQILPIKLLSFVMIAVALLFALLQVATLFSALVRERQKEIGMLIALGAAKLDVYRLLLSEAMIVSFIGSFVGVVFSLSILYDRQTLLYMIFQLPLLFPDLKRTLMISIFTIFTIMICTIVAAIFPVRTFISREPYEVVREGEN